ncbi:MAG: hypothetical protein ACLUIX_04990 [Oscillospiraceae bacterium]
MRDANIKNWFWRPDTHRPMWPPPSCRSPPHAGLCESGRLHRAAERLDPRPVVGRRLAASVPCWWT